MPVIVPIPFVAHAHAEPFHCKTWLAEQVVNSVKEAAPLEAPPLNPLPVAVFTAVIVPDPTLEQAHADPFHCRT
jgi:hypothetical protein